MKLISILLCILMLLPCALTALAESDNFSITMSEGFTAVYEWESDKSAAAKRLGLKESELEEYFEDNDVLMVAVNADNTSQLRLSKYDNEFSELAFNMSALSESEIAELAPLIAETKADIKTVSNGGVTYITFSEQHNDSGGLYTATQYITVFEGDIYRLSCYNQGNTESSDMHNMFLSLKLKSEEHHSAPLWITLLIIAAIALFAAIGIAMIMGIIRDKKSEKEELSEN